MRVVVSLTTLPERAALLAQAVASLQRQTRVPDAVYVWCPAERFRSVSACPTFPGAQVRLTPDLGPATKLLPILPVETDPDTRVIVVDDDVIYPPDLIAKLCAGSELFPDQAIGFTGWSLAPGDTGPTVVHWNEEVADAAMFQPVRVLEGYRGVVYRRAFLGPDLAVHLSECAAFRCHDDILFSGYLGRRGVTCLARWYGLMPRPAGELWGLQGQEIGLHRRPDWLALGREAVEYWARLVSGWLDPLSGVPSALRLQLATGPHPRLGFIHHGESPLRGTGPLTHDLDRLPWPWPSAAFAELLGVDLGQRAGLALGPWLTECHRLLRPGGVLRLWLAAPLEHGVKPVGRGWRLVQETHAGGLILTLFRE